MAAEETVEGGGTEELRAPAAVLEGSDSQLHLVGLLRMCARVCVSVCGPVFDGQAR